MIIYQVFRPHLSRYFTANYLEREREELEGKLNSCEKIKYVGPDELPDLNLPTILITDTHFKADTSIPAALWKKVILIIHPNSGHDNFPPHILKEFNFPFIKGNILRAKAVAEYILTILFNHYNQVPRQQEWNRQMFNERFLLSEQKILLFGYGHIGKIIAQSLSPLIDENNFFIVDPYKGNFPSAPKGVKFDAIVMACELTEETMEMVNETFFQEYFHEHSLLINAARGSLVKLDDLRKRAFDFPNNIYYLDVFPHEPRDLEKLKTYANIFCTSHLAGVYQNLDKETLSLIKKEIISFFQLRPRDLLPHD